MFADEVVVSVFFAGVKDEGDVLVHELAAGIDGVEVFLRPVGVLHAQHFERDDTAHTDLFAFVEVAEAPLAEGGDDAHAGDFVAGAQLLAGGFGVVGHGFGRGDVAVVEGGHAFTAVVSVADVGCFAGGDVFFRHGVAAFFTGGSGVSFGRMVARLRAWAGEDVGFFFGDFDEAEFGSPEADDVAGDHPGLAFDFSVVEGGAVGAVEIGDLAASADYFELAVNAGEFTVSDAVGVGGVAADGSGLVFGQEEEFPLLNAGDDFQGQWHESYPYQWNRVQNGSKLHKGDTGERGSGECVLSGRRGGRCFFKGCSPCFLCLRQGCAYLCQTSAAQRKLHLRLRRRRLRICTRQQLSLAPGSS